MNAFGDLGRDIAQDQERRSRRLDLEAARSELAGRVALLPGRRPVWTRAFVAAACVSAAAAGVTAWWFARQPDASFRVAGETVSARSSPWIFSTDDQPVPIDFHDGSRVMVTSGALARIASVEKNETKVQIERGRAELDIVPRSGKRWQVGAGPFLIQVTGTRFDVEWDPRTEHFALRMREGKVIVTGCGVVSKVVSGTDLFRASCKEGRIDTRNDPEQADERPTENVEPPSAPRLQDSRREKGAEAKGTASWRELADTGRYAEALAAADAQGFDSQCARLPSADLLALGNVARMAARADHANRAFLALRKRFPRDTSASVAAFNIARVAFDLARDYGRAAEWFQTYLRESPKGSLAREAQGRLMEALERGGDVDGARRSAGTYLARYPDGPHAEFARRLLK